MPSTRALRLLHALLLPASTLAFNVDASSRATAASLAVVQRSRPSLAAENAGEDLKSFISRAKEDPTVALQLVKDAGVAGAISYTLVELTFFGIALPIGYFAWHANTGEWLQPLLLVQDGSGEDKARLVGLILSYVVLLKTLFPLRLGSTLLMTPRVKNLLQRLG